MKARNLINLSALLTIVGVLMAGCTGLQTLSMETPSADAESAEAAMLGLSHAEGLVVSHPATGAMEPIDGSAQIVRSGKGVLVAMHAMGLEPGNVYTAWWGIVNNPEVCEAHPCSGGDIIGKAVAAETVVSYADGVIAGENGDARFAAYLPAGEVMDDPWFPENSFSNPTGAEIQLVINDHGPQIPELVAAMLNSYRSGCTDDSLPPPFPETAKADGEPGPNACALVQTAIFQATIP